MGLRCKNCCNARGCVAVHCLLPGGLMQLPLNKRHSTVYKVLIMYFCVFKSPCTSTRRVCKPPIMPQRSHPQPVLLKDTSINKQLSPPALDSYMCICMIDVEPGFICEHHNVPVCAPESQMTTTPVHSDSPMTPCRNLAQVLPKCRYWSVSRRSKLLCCSASPLQKPAKTDGADAST